MFLNKIRSLIKKIKGYFLYEDCYDDMERQGISAFSMCGGNLINSGYLSPQCIDCPYYVGFKKE